MIVLRRLVVTGVAAVLVVTLGMTVPVATGQTTESGRGAADSRRALAGRTIVIDPGHQLGNHNFPAEDQPQGPGGRLHEALQHHRDRDPRRPSARRRSCGGSRLLLQRRLEGSAPRVMLTRHSNRQDRWGPCVDERGRRGNNAGADLKLSIHGGRQLHPRRPRVPRHRADRPPAVDTRHLQAVAAAGPGDQGGAAARRGPGRQLHRRWRRPRLPLRPRHPQPLRHPERRWSSSATCAIAATPTG